jgi:hypothetical protein
LIVPPERLDAILEVDEAGSPARIRAAASVVADRKAEPRVVEIEIDLDPAMRRNASRHS